MIKKIQNFREATAPKVDVRVDGRDPGHLFEAEATRFFGGGARVRSRADRRRIRGPAAWRRRGTDARGEILVSSWFGEERARGPTAWCESCRETGVISSESETGPKIELYKSCLFLYKKGVDVGHRLQSRSKYGEVKDV